MPLVIALIVLTAYVGSLRQFEYSYFCFGYPDWLMRGETVHFDGNTMTVAVKVPSNQSCDGTDWRYDVYSLPYSFGSEIALLIMSFLVIPATIIYAHDHTVIVCRLDD